MAGETDRPAGKPEKEQKPPQAEQKPPPPAPPVPAFLDVTSSGEDGKYTFDIQVISDKGTGIQAQIRIVEGGSIRKILPTNEHGFLEYAATPFTEPQRDFCIRVIGAQLEEFTDTLPGPKQPQAKKEKLKPIAGAGFWTNAFKKK